MHRADSDFGPLEPVKHLPRTIRHVFNTCVVIGGLVGGGVSIGYFLGVQQQKQDSLAEIARLQVAYGLRLERAADSVTTAAKVTSSAAEAVGEAADQVGAAAKTATTAAITAKAAAKASAVPAPVPAAAVNNTIKRANEKLQGGRP